MKFHHVVVLIIIINESRQCFTKKLSEPFIPTVKKTGDLKKKNIDNPNKVYLTSK